MAYDVKFQDAVKRALKAASGKGMGPAVEAACGVLDEFLNHRMSEDSFSVQEEPPLPPPIVIASKEDPLDELPPIDRDNRVGKSVTRKRRSLADIGSIVDRDAPPYIEVIPEGRVETLTLTRHMMADQTSGGLQLCYQPPKMDPGMAYPKCWFFETDDNAPDVSSAISKMQAEAVKIYRLRTGPITTTVKDLGPLSNRMAAREQV